MDTFETHQNCLVRNSKDLFCLPVFTDTSIYNKPLRNNINCDIVHLLLMSAYLWETATVSLCSTIHASLWFMTYRVPSPFLYLTWLTLTNTSSEEVVIFVTSIPIQGGRSFKAPVKITQTWMTLKNDKNAFAKFYNNTQKLRYKHVIWDIFIICAYTLTLSTYSYIQRWYVYMHTAWNKMAIEGQWSKILLLSILFKNMAYSYRIITSTCCTHFAVRYYTQNNIDKRNYHGCRRF